MAERKQHGPTPHRLRQARREGKVLKTKFFSESTQLFLVGGLLFLCSGFLWIRAEKLLEFMLLPGRTSLEVLRTAFQTVAVVSAICLAVLGSIALVIEFLQVGIRFEGGLFAPRASRLSVAQGWARLSSGIRDLWQIVVRFVVLALILFWFFNWFFPKIASSLFASEEFQLSLLRGSFGSCLFLLGGALFLFGTVDYLVRKGRFEAELSMSHDELRREYKEQEGDPLTRSARKGLHERILHEDLVQRVRRSRVIVVRRRRE